MTKETADFRILGEEEDFVVVEKPAGLLVHPSKPGGPRTLWDGLRELLGYELVNGGQVSIINRLDRETSGVILVCKNAPAARKCAMAMQRGEILKEYLAVVQGWPEVEQFEVKEPIIRLGEVAESRVWLKRTVHPGGAPSHTRFVVKSRETHSELGKIALIHAEPLTGRTHQIRVHLSHAGYPVIGDKLYGPSDLLYLRFVDTGWTEELRRELYLSRHALHSTRLAMKWNDEWISWDSELPPDMAGLLSGD